MRIKGENPQGGAMTSWFTVSVGFRRPHESKTKPGRFETTSEGGFRSFGQRIRRLRVDGRPNRTRPLRFRHEIGFVWTGPHIRHSLVTADFASPTLKT